jgi:hypothetical protein
LKLASLVVQALSGESGTVQIVQEVDDFQIGQHQKRSGRFNFSPPSSPRKAAEIAEKNIQGIVTLRNQLSANSANPERSLR